MAQPEKIDCESEYANAYLIAKEALMYVSTFRTPPTPEVYEVWFRFVEGGNVAIQEQLSHAVKVAKSVTANQLEQLRKQFLESSVSSQANQEICRKLAIEIERLQTIISFQQGANVEFSSSIAFANEGLMDENLTTGEIKSCLIALLKSNERMQQQMAVMDAKMKASQSQIVGLSESLLASQKELLNDPLTGVGNRRFFDDILQQAQITRTNESQVCLLLVDLDNFKNINDTHGHAVGDEVLRFVAKEMQKIAVDASISRFGGDEFAIITNSPTPGYAHQLANSICEFFSERQLTLKRTGSPLGDVTASIGVAILRHDDDANTWFERADKLLYSAKCAGRNRTMVERKLID